MKTLLENWKYYIKEQVETDSQFMQRMIVGDQQLRNLFQKDIADAGGWSQELLNKFVEKHKTSKDDVFGDSSRVQEFLKREPSFKYSSFSDEDWNNWIILVMHLDNHEDMQLKGLDILEEEFGKLSPQHKKLLWRIGSNRKLIKIPSGYIVPLVNIENEAKKFGVDWNDLYNKIKGQNTK